MKPGELETFCVTKRDPSLYDEIEEFISSSPFSHFRQSVSWMQCHQDIEPYFYVVSKYDTKIVAASLVRQRRVPLIGKSKYFIDRGPVVLNLQYLSAHLEGIKDQLKKTAFWIRINPYIWDDNREEARRCIEDNMFIKTNASVYTETIVMDLSQTENDLWKGLRRALKTQINKADMLGVKIEHVNKESDLRGFIWNYNTFARRKSIPQIPSAISKLLYKKIFSNETNGNILLARYKGKILSGIAVIASADRAIFEWGFNNINIEDKYIPASHKLHWEVILWAKQKGLRFYDFGGYNTEEGSKYGLNHFKLGFSKIRQQIIPEYLIVYDSLWVRVARLISLFRR